MSNDQFTVEDNTRSGGGGCTTIVIGCLVVCLVLAGIACGVGYYIYATTNWNELVANVVEPEIKRIINETDLPEDQKEGMNAQVTRLADGYREGKITFVQLKQVGDSILKSPIISAIPVEVARVSYIDPSGLSDEEKANATKQLERVAHGMFEEKIDEKELEELIDGRIADKNKEGKLEFRQKVTDEQLREFVTACQKLADSKGIPDQEYKIDFAAELKKAVDAALDGKPAEPNADGEDSP
ncbi:hypothetical protein DTL42_04200 [Bremerella cremea]|uniref:Uncharacterized protein n=1 Tax=Bremerella cremea TaxID=1031537 RepID=A0A368KXG3_9BACT|nr:hypothetical protein [Bremerella cremea]RCS54355.1 hypothetical protein DTL42_04200 [Bremerella cremea]